jgi:hypothetical protein
VVKIKNIAKLVLATIILPFYWLIAIITGDNMSMIEVYKDIWDYYIIRGEE